MNFEFSDEQVMLRDSLSRLLDQRYAFELRRRIMAGQAETGIWSELVDMGIVPMPLPEACGGLGGSASDIVAISELFGRHLVIEPLLPSVILTGRALARFDPAGPVPQWIADIGTGALRGAFAHEEGSGTGASSTLSTKLYEGEAGPRIRGSKKLVLGGGEAGVLLISAFSETKAVCLAAVPADAEGIEVRRYRALDGRPVADILLHDVAVDRAAIMAGADAALEALLADARLALAAEAVGAMAVLMATTADFAGTREQFGRPIGSFQAIAHRLADMKIAYVKARASLLYIAALADSGRATSRDISVLKAQVGRLGREIAQGAVQIHGGIGMTDELPVGHYLKHILTIDGLFGNTDYHLREIGRVVAAA